MVVNIKLAKYKLKNFTIYGKKDEYIFSTIRNTKNFYEIEILKSWNRYLSSVNTILDIGANIGNHSIYWAQNENVTKIFAFEPLKSTFEILERNIKCNDIRKVEIFQMGVGDKESFAKIDNQDPNNLGATSLRKIDYKTDIRIISIDDFLNDKNYSIDLVKIDVEGFEVLVLNGMFYTIKKYKPIIWVEVTLETVKDVLDILNRHEYYILDIIKFNILAIHKTKIGDFDPVSQETIIFNMLKNLSASWMYRNKAISAEQHQKKYLSKYLFEQQKCESLQRDQDNNKKIIHKLKKDLESYKSRKIVRFADKVLRIIYLSKKYFYLILYNTYSKIKRFKKITNLIHYINNRFNLINKEYALKTLYSSQSSNFPKKAHSIVNKKINDIKVAILCDEFTYNCFRYEFDAITFNPSNWPKIFEMEKPDLFLCESAWSGVDSIKRPWKGKIYSSTNFKNENRIELFSILDYCKKNNIPTIFWNKEDPTHYNDKIHNFVDTAMKFDHIFTTAEECVPMYMDKGHKSVHCLPFAGQPKLFNPIEKFTRTEDIIFAGSWYNNHNQRCIEMDEIFDSILDGGYNLKIYDREYGTNDPNRIFPDKYNIFTHPPVKFNHIEKVYKESKYGLNINTETKSKTMFARRVFELMLCNTLVLSNYSKGMDELFGDNVVFVDKTKLNLSDSEEKREINLYNVLDNHTYSKRFEQILNAINFEYIPVDERVTLYYIANNQSEIDEILKHYESVDYSNKKLALLLSKDFPNHLIKNLYQKYANNEVYVYSLFYLLDQCGKISNDTPYFVFADTKMEMDFIKKAILHYSYIDKSYGITFGDKKFKFDKFNNAKNVLFDTEFFNVVFDYIFGFNSSIEIPVYLI